MKIKITIICENSVDSVPGIIAEHGLSILIENETNTLFDTGQGLGVINNLSVMRKDVNAIDRIILSHGHYDHTGGLLSVLKMRNGKIPVFAHSSVFNLKYKINNENNIIAERYIGMPEQRAEYEKAGAEFRFISGHSRVSERISAFSEIKRPAGWKCWDSKLKLREHGEIADDPFSDDLSLLLETESGPVVILGCAHAGIVEILDDISSQTGIDEFHAVIGGTHLNSAPDDYVNKAVEAIKKYNVKTIAPCHCTGYEKICMFAGIFKDKFFRAQAGSVFEF